jgi:hypothetical protein
VRELKIRQPRDSQRQRADRCRGTSALAVEIHPEASQAANGKRKIDRCAAMVGVLQPRRHERHHRGFDIVGGEYELRSRKQSARYAYDRRRTRHKQEVTSLEFTQPAKPGFDRTGAARCVRRAQRSNEIQLGCQMV